MKIRPIRPIRVPNSIWCVLLALLVFPACYEPVEGCLDVAATNFNAAADEDCCCTYPKLTMNVSQNFGPEIYLSNKNLEIEPGRFFKIKTAVFYLSDFQTVQSGVAFPVSDSIRLETFPDSAKTLFTDDFQIVRRTQGAYEIGELRQAGKFEEIKFSLGLSDEANRVIPGRAPSGHPLRPQAEVLWKKDTGFVFVKLEFTRDSAASAPVETISFSKFDFQKMPLSFQGDFNHRSGYDFVFTLAVDFKKWFAGVDLTNDDISTIKDKIRINLPTGFTVSQ